MNLITISNVSTTMDISTRTLRYYEELGLIESTRTEGYAYRVYDEQNIRRLQQVIILKKLNIPLKKIKEMLESNDTIEALNVFEEKIQEIDDEVDSLNTVKSVLDMLVYNLRSNKSLKLSIDNLDEEDVIKIIETSTLFNNLKEKKTMSDLNQASEVINKVDNVRIIHIPTYTVAAAYAGVGKEPERKSQEMLKTFIQDSGLCNVTKDIRVVGFNNPTPKGNEEYGYEFWVTIPEDFIVPKPLVKKTFEGGLYAAHCIKMGNFHEWQPFSKWVEESEEYEYEAREPLGMYGSLEEHLNAYSFYNGEEEEYIQLDLLIPIKKVK